MDKLFPTGWNAQKTFVWALLAALALNLGSDLYMKFVQPVVRGILNAIG
jgi:hypothetical protein